MSACRMDDSTWCFAGTCVDCDRERSHRCQVPDATVATWNPNNAALCQCTKCLRYLAENRKNDGTFINNMCEQCTRGGLKLAKIRGTLTDPTSQEILAMTSEECAEVIIEALATRSAGVIKRIGKITRWGWDADFEGTTQVSKLEGELGDVLAVTLVAAWNEQLSMTNVIAAAEAKLQKLREDAAGPRQRVLHALIPMAPAQYLLNAALRKWCVCGAERPCHCENDE